MFIFIIGIIVVLSLIGRLFSRPFYGYRLPRIFPFGGIGGLGGWGMGYPHHHHHHHPMGHCGPHHHHHHGGPCHRW